MANAAFDPARWQKLSSLFDEALDLPEAERAGWLERLAKDRLELARELETLLADHAASQRSDFLEGSVASADDLAAGGSLAGKVLGAYTLEAIVGQGGMGTVWRARRSDGRYSGSVAIKLLNIALVDGTSGARFQREGRILARLTHPHIARLIDAASRPAASRTWRSSTSKASPSIAIATPPGSTARHASASSSTCSARWRTRTPT